VVQSTRSGAVPKTKSRPYRDTARLARGWCEQSAGNLESQARPTHADPVMSTIRRLYFSLRSSVEFFDDPTLVKAGTAIAKVTPRRELAYTSTKPEPWHR
jgi:hypothetical protein